MKNLKKILSVLLVAFMVFGFAACGEKPVELPSDELTHDERSAEVYRVQLGEFKEAYDKVKDAKTLSERFALQAIAEAKLMESAVMLPGTTRGGNYRMGRTAFHSGSTVLWGSDPDRQHTIIVTDKILLKDDYNHLRELWNEVKASGTYTEKAIAYLESKGYAIQDELKLLYNSDPVTFDILGTSRQPDAQPIVNTLEGLAEYDNENTLKPAIAESWEKSPDGLTWTFHIRQGVKWVDAQGAEVAPVKADDFVAGMQHVLDAGGGLESLLFPIIKNSEAYVKGETDFSQVGVKAVDDATLVYTLEDSCPYFESMLTYSIFMPMSRAYYESKGGKFGSSEFQAAVDDGTCTYGTSPETIAYNGPYLITNHTKNNTFVFDANPSYWNPGNIQCHKIVWSFTDGKDATRPYVETKSGVIAGCGLTRSNLESAKKEIDDATGKTYFESYATISDTDGTSFVNFVNMNRTAFANYNDGTKGVSTLSEEEIKRTAVAVYNVHFRRAIGMALDMAAYNGVVVGDDLKLMSVRNSYVPGTFVSLSEDTVVTINGKEKTYPAGTFYGEVMQDQIDADNVKIKVWDRDNKTSDGFAGWYSPANAMEELNIAIKELKKQGVKVSAESPIHCELPSFATNPVYSARCNVFKQTVEASLEGNVVIDLVEYQSQEDYLYCAFNIEDGTQANYTLFDGSGWGPDYGDPATYLDTMLPDHDGYMTRVCGLW